MGFGEERGVARPVRVQFEDAVYHVTMRIGRDFWRQSRRLARFGLVVQSYCLLPTADCRLAAGYWLPNRELLSLIAQIPREPERGLKWLQTIYSIRFNRRHVLVAFFQGRFDRHSCLACPGPVRAEKPAGPGRQESGPPSDFE